jgi:hypothetical protein
MRVVQGLGEYRLLGSLRVPECSLSKCHAYGEQVPEWASPNSGEVGAFCDSVDRALFRVQSAS